MSTTETSAYIVARARAQLAELDAAESSEAPTGIVTIRDVMKAEAALGAAQRELAAYTRSDDSMFETLDSSGIRGLTIQRGRLESIEALTAKVEKARQSLTQLKRAWSES